MSVTVNGTNGLTFNDGSSQQTAASGFGFKNRIINGAMTIDQRNAGASVSFASGSSTYTVDRFVFDYSQTSKFTAQQNAGSVTPPAGFINYLGFTSTSAYSIGSSDYFLLNQRVEGLNIADLGWGTANAQPVTLSFWVYSSLTGTFGGSLRNSASNLSYPYSYSIPVANTWTKITVNVSGPTTGTWLTTNGIGMFVYFSLGAGATLSGAPGSWSANNYVSATGATSVVGTSGATFYITGVQLEKGSTATSFDYRPYGTELALCQRYYYKMLNSLPMARFATAGYSIVLVPLGSTMRVLPTITETNDHSVAVASGFYSGNGYGLIYSAEPVNGFYLTAFTASSEL